MKNGKLHFHQLEPVTIFFMNLGDEEYQNQVLQHRI